MNQDNEILKLVLDNLRKLFYPEEWIGIDMAVSKTELFTLLLIDQKGEVIMSQIADFVNAPMSTATGIIDRLVKNEYLKRERSETDRRIVLIRLTDNGRNFVEEFKAFIFKYIGMINEVLTSEERQLLFNVFQKIVNVINDNHIGDIKETEENKIKKIVIE